MHNRVAGDFSPQPPHHLACGSAPGGSRKSSGRSRTLNHIHDGCNSFHRNMIEWKQFHSAPISGSSVRIHRRYRAYQGLHSFPRSGLRPTCGTTMPSADFCTLTVSVSRNGAIGCRREMLSGSCFPQWGSYPLTATGYAWALFAGLAHPGFSHDDPIAWRADLPG
jgi:hypothetical protein